MLKRASVVLSTAALFACGGPATKTDAEYKTEVSSAMKQQILGEITALKNAQLAQSPLLLIGGAAPTALRVRSLKSLWGSLDSRDRVTLDLALALAPPAALKYVLVHELCHLKIRNHSPRFWALVSSHIPDWEDQRDWLRSNGQALKAELARLVQGSLD